VLFTLKIPCPFLKTSEKKCSPSLGMKEMQIKITLRFHLNPVRIPKIKNTTNKYWTGCGERRKFICCWLECKLVQSVKTVWRLLKK
jgi:hypothetical protein